MSIKPHGHGTTGALAPMRRFSWRRWRGREHGAGRWRVRAVRWGHKCCSRLLADDLCLHDPTGHRRLSRYTHRTTPLRHNDIWAEERERGAATCTSCSFHAFPKGWTTKNARHRGGMAMPRPPHEAHKRV
ncbi:hypothetical protein H310_08155 [Aphanomyces invadans]|uniref:Uncharacterized protein n=1 Tax=Aphanomyces invadans TaxID=157072 RepID=A0A024U1L2_9STRA|nr:hypothetical protein H310_08155 [Aphanomyces invadans]ETV99477.1 hypothetical protein H310_08155 [Aphanomyces invadans]|eukprot:XP_008872033.1 hypothetical protein H310_08155 [Aphanomyces invadans]